MSEIILEKKLRTSTNPNSQFEKYFVDFFSLAFKNIKEKKGILTTKETTDEEIKKILGL